MQTQTGSDRQSITPVASLLQMRGIVKRYGALTALDRVDLQVNAGEVHALLGENGAGKTTLMHILSGLTRSDEGVVSLCGEVVNITSPRVARALGIAMVHQHFTLAPAFTVAENLELDAMGSDSRSAKSRRSNSAGQTQAVNPTARALERAESLGWKLDPDAKIMDLPVGLQQRVEIAKALATDADLLIFDEPTAVLAGDEVEELFGVIRRLRDQGTGVILIAHKLAEILAVADRVTVLRRGKNVATSAVADTDADHLARWMVGVSPTNVVTSTPEVSPPGAVVVSADAGAAKHDLQQNKLQQIEKPPALIATSLCVTGDRGEQALRAVSLTVRRGEIFGVGGVDGNGQVELAEALVGIRSLTAGSITWHSRPFVPSIAPRIGFIPQDRRRFGLAVSMSIEDNLLYDAVRDPAYRIGPFLKRGMLRRLAERLRAEFDIRTQDLSQPASALSGGNQQKIVVARALYSKPEWIVAMNPTRGLDIGATRFVHSQLLAARERGAAILLISTDMDELTALSDRGGILSGGNLTEYQFNSDAAQLGLLLGGIGVAQQDLSNRPAPPELGATA